MTVAEQRFLELVENIKLASQARAGRPIEVPPGFEFIPRLTDFQFKDFLKSLGAMRVTLDERLSKVTMLQATPAFNTAYTFTTRLLASYELLACLSRPGTQVVDPDDQC